MDSMNFDCSLPSKNTNSQCLVCGSHSLANYVDLSLSTSRTSQSDTLIKSKLRHILLNSWVSSDSEVILCLPCFHLVDQFDVLEAQLEAIQKELTDKYVSRTGFRSKVKEQQSSSVTPKKVQAELKRKRRPYTKRKKQQTFDDLDSYVPPENSVLNQRLEHSLNVHNDVPEMHSVSAALVWSQDSVQLQQLGDITVMNNNQVASTQLHPQAQVECSVNTPQTLYDNDPNFLNSGERLRIGTEINDGNVISFACVYCNQIILNIEGLKSHVHMHHFPKLLTTPIPVELGLGNVMNCGVQLENVNNVALDSVKPFACIFCDASFKFKSNLSLHFKEKHTPNKPFSCIDCLESFRRSMELSRHKVYYCPHRKKNLPRKDKKNK